MRKINCPVSESSLTPGFPGVNQENPAPLSRREGKSHLKVACLPDPPNRAWGECGLKCGIQCFLLLQVEEEIKIRMKILPLQNAAIQYFIRFGKN
jgi:hypothetical protein